MLKILLAVSNLGLLQRHCGPLRPLGRLPIHLAAVSLRPHAIWFSTQVHWRCILDELGRRGARRGNRGASPRYLLPYLEQDALIRRGWGYVRAGSFASVHDPRGLVSGLLPTSSPAAVIADGTSNTLLLEESTPGGRTPGSTTTGGAGAIADGTSNTIFLGEAPPAGGAADTPVGGHTGRQPRTPGSGPGGGSASPTTGAIADGTSNTFLIGVVPVDPRGTGAAGNITDITDGTSNTILFVEG
jgi:hypothetical protein